ncbi:hypothetical protein ATSB10_05710 [Dyella thiooxydans]|uniref:GlcNAc-PI de-N-acetylase n=1 Tax=Dyella thiooxydans TaxID=445710 RepID=A0A169GPH5_9GAMM|nr:PIG-L domain-containing protein [Dyella thiooxydans]AND68025.1 hypothetical protein ATSB10_05710 [Dyella thiooxydans]
MDILSARTRLLVVAPHPDDETLATGILIQRVLAAGGSVHVLLLTDGDNNPWPQRRLERRLWVGRQARARWASRRRGEFMAALGELGLSGTDMTAMSWPDQGLTRMIASAAGACMEALDAVIARVQPTLVAMPALDDRHPDHGAAHVLMRLVLERQARAPVVWLYRVHGGARRACPSVACVADASTWSRKRAALARHASQLVLSRRRMERLAARTERYEVLSTGPLPRDLPWAPRWPQRTCLRLTAAAAGTGVAWRWARAPVQREPGQGGRLAAQALPAGEGALFVKLELTLPSFWIFDHWGWRELRR